MSEAAGKVQWRTVIHWDCFMALAFTERELGRKETGEETGSRDHGLNCNWCADVRSPISVGYATQFDGPGNEPHSQQLLVEMRQSCHLGKKTQV